MATVAPRARIEWLMEPGTAEATPADAQRLAVGDDGWTARIERIDVSSGLHVSLTDAEVHEPLAITASHTGDGRWLFSNVLARGRTRIEAAGTSMELDARRSLLFHAPDREARYGLYPGPLRIAAFMLSADRLASLLDGAVPPLLRAPHGDNEEAAMLPTATSEGMRRLVGALFAERLSGALRLVFIEGAVLQLLALQAESLTSAERNAGAPRPHADRGPASPRERHAILAARERLLADMRAPPSLATLAEAAGLSEKALNAGFRRQFGATIFEVLRNERLDHARLALEQGELPMKVIADRVGYRHVSNFILAFTRRYGEPPARYARGHGRAEGGPENGRPEGGKRDV